MVKDKAAIAGLVHDLGYTPESVTDPGSFNQRLKLQKTVFLLKHWGVPAVSGYDFSMYLKGPYSPSLAKDYYSLDGVAPRRLRLTPRHTWQLRWFFKHDTKWLEIASSILAIRDKYVRIDDAHVFRVLRISKPWVSAERFNEVSKDLRLNKI